MLLLIQTTALASVSGGRWALVPLAVVIAADWIRSHAGTTFGGLGAVLTGDTWRRSRFGSARSCTLRGRWWRGEQCRTPSVGSWPLMSGWRS